MKKRILKRKNISKTIILSSSSSDAERVMAAAGNLAE